MFGTGLKGSNSNDGYVGVISAGRGHWHHSWDSLGSLHSDSFAVVAVTRSWCVLLFMEEGW